MVAKQLFYSQSKEKAMYGEIVTSLMRRFIAFSNALMLVFWIVAAVWFVYDFYDRVTASMNAVNSLENKFVQVPAMVDARMNESLTNIDQRVSAIEQHLAELDGHVADIDSRLGDFAERFWEAVDNGTISFTNATERKAVTVETQGFASEKMPESE